MHNIKVKKRDGRIVDYSPIRIETAIKNALDSVGFTAAERRPALLWSVETRVYAAADTDAERTVDVEDIQDACEYALMAYYPAAAKAFILYREQRRRTRDAKKIFATSTVDKYLGKADWRIRENSNSTFSLQGLNNYVVSDVMSRYWLDAIYPAEIRDAHDTGEIHIHDLGLLSPYCVGWSLEDILLNGFGGIPGKSDSAPPKHFRSALGQIVNFIYTLQGEASGAQALSNFDTLLAPFVRADDLTDREVKQALQEFVFNMNVPTRVGFQAPFSNITMDLDVPDAYKDQPVIIGGKRHDVHTYGAFGHEMSIINRMFAEVMMEGDAKGRVFTFPIPTYNITKDFEWGRKDLGPVWKMAGRYGIPYFSNFVNSDMSPDDARSMCCRLRLDNRELHKRGGGLFGANPLTGSIGVVTINLPQAAYGAESLADFRGKVDRAFDKAVESLEIKRKVIESYTGLGLYPYSARYLESVKQSRGAYWANHFSTVGVIGAWEAIRNLRESFGFHGHLRESFVFRSHFGTFAETLLEYLRKKIAKVQEDTGNLYNLEATPGEGTTYRLAQMDLRKHPDTAISGTLERPYYTNSTQLPVDYTDDIDEALSIQSGIQSLYTGGTVFNAYLGEEIRDPETVQDMVRHVCETYEVPYFTLTPTFSVCRECGYLPGEQPECPKCGGETEVYSRVVGYIRPVSQWNDGKQAEYEDRKEYEL